VSDHVRTELAGASNTLLLTGASDFAGDDLCVDLMQVTEPEQTNLLWVTYTRSPDNCLRSWLDRARRRPDEIKIISVGDMMRSAAAASGGTTARTPIPSAVDSVSNPADLTGLGIKISAQLQEWSQNANRTVVCFDSLTTLLQYVDLQTIYKFLHVLTGRFETVDARAYFHLDPSAHDQATVSTLKSLFEAVVEPNADDTLHVATR
jgi:hypothetical protein